jgi:hypothetical protein
VRSNVDLTAIVEEIAASLPARALDPLKKLASVAHLGVLAVLDLDPRRKR